ncbi:DUF2520 domain-containing protein [Granulosicoccaceae sp. 1_MG-2023]|nr:DUF2520 domain-containing protein [Granulosicoccaceae sp. 1_MG-2023]
MPVRQTDAPSISLIGAGKLGKTLARLFYTQAGCRIAGVTTRSRQSAQQAVDFIGAGTVADQADSAAGIILLAVPDDAIAASCRQLLRSAPDLSNKLVFHCSGSLSSDILAPAADAGALTASVHPVFSFADPASAVSTFAGTPCGVEGNGRALAVLEKLFNAIGGRCSRIDPARKSLYHCAAVMANNYTVALQYLATQLYRASGMKEDEIAGFILPILQGTVDNIRERGVEESLTGPIARGDTGTIGHHLQALQSLPAEISHAYRALGLASCALLESRNPQEAAKTTPAIRALLASVPDRDEA